jgi:transposase
MPLTKQIQFELHQMLLQGKSYATIATQLSISHPTIAKYKKKLGLSITPNKGGWPCLISKKDRHRLVHSIWYGQVDTAPQAKQLLGLNVSNQMVQNVLREANLRAHMKAKKPLLSKRHMACCLNFTFTHWYWTQDDWACVIFSDETKIN